MQAAIELYKTLGDGLKKTGPQHDAKVCHTVKDPHMGRHSA